MAGAISGRPLAPKEAIRYFEAKGYRVSWHWQDTLKEQHARDFTIAHCDKPDVLISVKRGLDRYLREGRPLSEFQREMAPQLVRAGWWGRIKGINPKTGKEEEYEAGSPHRLKVIFETNMRVAYAAGMYKKMMEQVDVAPWWQYFHPHRAGERKEHQALNGKVFRYDDPFWAVNYPPNGWGCQCRVIPLSDNQVRQLGLEPSSGLGADGQLRPEYREVAPLEWRYNPGASAWRGITPGELDNPAGWTPVGPNTPEQKIALRDLPEKDLAPIRPGDLLPEADELRRRGMDEDQIERSYVQTFLGEFGAEIGKPVSFQDAMNDRMPISDDLFINRALSGVTGKTQYKAAKRGRERYLKILADTIKNPTEIWLAEMAHPHSGKTVLRKRYIKVFRDQQGRVAGLSVFEYGKDGWTGTTVFQPDNLEYAEKQRDGVLLYRGN